MKYLPIRSDLPIFQGPLGQTSSAWVSINNGKVEYIQWQYLLHQERGRARELWSKDRQFQTVHDGKQLIGRKKVRYGSLMALCGSETGSSCDDIFVVTLSAE